MLIVKRESEHAAQLLNALRPILFIKMNNDFGIGMSEAAMAAGLQLRAQLGKVIDLAVVDNPNGLIFVEDRLVPARQVDDAEPAHAQSDASLHKHSLVVGPTMHDGFAHPVNGGAIHPAVRMSLDHSCYAAHALSFQHRCTPLIAPGIGRRWTHSLELVIPVLSPISFLAIAGRQNDIHHLSSGNKMQNLPSFLRTTGQFADKFLHGSAE